MLRTFLISILTALVCFVPGVLSADAFNELSQYIASDGVVYADETVINRAFSGKRDFTVAMLLTSESGKLDCQFCRILGPNFKTLASSYQAQVAPEDRDLFFVLADVENTTPTFKTLGISHVPNLVFFPPTQSKSDAKQGIKAPHSFASFTTVNDEVEYLASVFSKHGFSIKVIKPFPWYKLTKVVATLIAAGAGGYFFKDLVIKIWTSKQVWLALSLMCVIMFISGHMFNVTRGTPFMGFDGVSITMVEPNFNSQLAVETQILATIYAVLAFTTIGLIKFIPKLTSLKAQTLGAVFGSLTILIVYSILLEVFKIKMGGFPISLLPIKLF